jgi:hypothetical protein
MSQTAQDMITSVEEWNVSKCSYGPVRTNARGGKSIKVLDENRNNLLLEAPLILTWGVNKMVDEDTGRVSYNMALQFPSGEYGNQATQAFMDKMKDFEDKVLEDAVANSKAWFNKSGMIREVAEALFTPLLRYPKNKDTGEPDYDRSPSLRVKIPYWEGKFSVELYDMDGNCIFDGDSTSLADKPFETYIPKGSHVATMLQCNGLWFAAGKFGVTWKLVQAMIRSPVRIKGRCFFKTSASDRKEQLERADREEAFLKEKGVIGNDDDEEVVDTTVADSDDEEEVAPAPAPAPEPEPEPEPEPAPAPKKAAKKVAKKVSKRKVTKKKE